MACTCLECQRDLTYKGLCPVCDMDDYREQVKELTEKLNNVGNWICMHESLYNEMASVCVGLAELDELRKIIE